MTNPCLPAKDDNTRTVRRRRRVLGFGVAWVAVAVLGATGGAAAASPNRPGAEDHTMHAPAPATQLKAIFPAPASVEISIELIPKSYVYLGHDSAAAFYGPPGTNPQNAFGDGIVADVHLTLPGTKFPLTIDGHPASYDRFATGSSLRLKWNNRIDVGFQTSSNAPITKAQAEQIASTINVRSMKSTTKG